MKRQELELKAKEFDSKLKRHPMSTEELQKVLCDFVESLQQPSANSESELLLAFAKYAMPDKFTSIALKNIVNSFLEDRKNDVMIERIVNNQNFK